MTVEMDKLDLGAHTRKFICEIADEQVPEWGEKLTAEDWEVVCACVGLQLMTRGQLPPEVTFEMQVLMTEVALRTGLPLRMVEPASPKMFR